MSIADPEIVSIVQAEVQAAVEHLYFRNVYKYTPLEARRLLSRQLSKKCFSKLCSDYAIMPIVDEEGREYFTFGMLERLSLAWERDVKKRRKEGTL